MTGTYRGWSIDHIKPPIPTKDFDWTATHPSFDGPEDGRQVWAATREALETEVDAWIAENGSGVRTEWLANISLHYGEMVVDKLVCDLCSLDGLHHLGPCTHSRTPPAPAGEGKCRVCGGGGWVCENHLDRPWGGLSNRSDACECGAGAPCQVCDLERAIDGRVIAAERSGFIAGRDAAVAEFALLGDAIRSARDFASGVTMIESEAHLALARRDIGRIVAAIDTIRAIEAPGEGAV